MAETARARGFEPARIHVMGYGVDVKAARGAAPEDEEKLYECIFLGRFHEQKGLEDLLPIWRRVMESMPNSRLAVVGTGTGPAATAFKAEVSRQFDGSISQLGVLQGEEKYAALRQAKVFVFPSHHESWGHVVLEAMAAGLPVVGYDLPSSSQAFGSALLTVPTGDISAFADAILRLLKSNDLYQDYRERGRRVAAGNDWDQIAQRFANRLWG